MLKRKLTTVLAMRQKIFKPQKVGILLCNRYKLLEDDKNRFTQEENKTKITVDIDKEIIPDRYRKRTSCIPKKLGCE
jgi:predicted ribosome quality control (RQC) complex YloA/Tae2 family protein